ncbi:hypothetical protein ACIPLC_13750 [Kitasatospora sp. NPDC086801]|uniref:hypothetical protein n=1 Tax=Kitasatospora sp. NPDC086801 TaxID=3364066 RepID=UPI00382CD2B6
MNVIPLVGLSCCVALLMAVAGVYLVRVRMPRPPVGVYTSSDIAVLCVGVVLAPLLYVNLPGVVVSALFGLVLCLAVQFTLAPVLSGRWAWGLALVAAGVTAACSGHPVAVRAGTDVMLAVAVVGVANLWTQSGMRSAHAAALAAVLSCYDLVATTLTQVTAHFVTQVQGRPFAPMLVLTGGSPPVAVGLGDLLLLVLYPLVAAKAFGRTAALLAAAAGVVVTSAVSALFALGALTEGFPLLTALGPLIVVQHVVWSRRLGGERTTARWRAGTESPAPRPDRLQPDAAVASALAVPAPAELAAGTWIAVADGRLVGTGDSPGLARRDARQRGTDTLPLVRQL